MQSSQRADDGLVAVAAATLQDAYRRVKKDFGADAVIDYSSEDLKTSARELSDGGVDVVVKSSDDVDRFCHEPIGLPHDGIHHHKLFFDIGLVMALCADFNHLSSIFVKRTLIEACKVNSFDGVKACGGIPGFRVENAESLEDRYLV